MVSDISLWIFVACVIGFLVAIGLTIKSYRDAKYASYFFLREEAALRVRRLLLVLIPLAIVIVFVGLRLFGPGGISPILATSPAGVNLSRTTTPGPQTPKITRPLAVTPTADGASTSATIGQAATTMVPPTVLPETSTPVTLSRASSLTLPSTIAPTSPPATVEASTSTSAAAAETPAPTLAPAEPPRPVPDATAARLPGPGGTPPGASTENGPTAALDAVAESTTATMAAPTTTSANPAVSVTAEISITSTSTATDTPVVGKTTPRPDAFLGSLILSRGIGPNKTPLQPSSTFNTNDAYIYVFYEFHNMANGIAWSHRWFRGATEVGSESNLWNYGTDGRGYLFFSPAVGPGQYEIRLYIGDKVMASAPFQIK
jgi:hypothetical protein